MTPGLFNWFRQAKRDGVFFNALSLGRVKRNRRPLSAGGLRQRGSFEFGRSRRSVSGNGKGAPAAMPS